MALGVACPFHGRDRSGPNIIPTGRYNSAMRRLWRWMFNAAAVLSLLLFIGTAALWARSYWVEHKLVRFGRVLYAGAGPSGVRSGCTHTKTATPGSRGGCTKTITLFPPSGMRWDSRLTLASHWCHPAALWQCRTGSCA
jgi:hypothetical protein